MIQENTDTTKQAAGLADVLKKEFAVSNWPKEGSVVEATLIKKFPRKAFFDLGRFATGIVYGIEMINAREAIKNMKAGDRVSAKVVSLDGEAGNIELSLAEAGKQKLWQQAKELLETGEIIKVKIMAANAGGLMASLSGSELKAFLPVSQLSLDHYPRVGEGDRQKIADELKKFIGQELEAKIIDVNPRTNKIIVSEREVLSANVKELLSKYQAGQTIEALVSGIADFGVFVRFVDNPEIEGMIHISELDYRLVDNPKELVKVNDQIKVKIVDIRDGKVFLSLRALKSDPWEKIEEQYKSGQEIMGQVYKLNQFGAVINLEAGIQGLIHISEFGGQDEMKAALVAGTSYKFIIDSVKSAEKRIILKLKK
ncbi:MAG: S1 RNA-binding domain-containing protein [Patescibacteria group bacterium]